jgi:hypothetical protein
LIRIVSAVIDTGPVAVSTATVCGSANSARPTTILTVSLPCTAS